jgi:hypothetical protein
MTFSEPFTISKTRIRCGHLIAIGVFQFPASTRNRWTDS